MRVFSIEFRRLYLTHQAFMYRYGEMLSNYYEMSVVLSSHLCQKEVKVFSALEIWSFFKLLRTFTAEKGTIGQRPYLQLQKNPVKVNQIKQAQLL